jgi:hypothetical protein
LVQAYADSLKVVWVVMCGLAGLGLLASLLIQDYPLDRFAIAGKVMEGEGEVYIDTGRAAGVVEKR